MTHDEIVPIKTRLRTIAALLLGALASTPVAYSQTESPEDRTSAVPRPNLRFSASLLKGQYSDQQSNQVTEVTSKVDGLGFSGKSLVLERYGYRDEHAPSSDAWFASLGAIAITPNSEDWQQSRQIQLLGGYTLPFVDPKTLVFGFRLLTNERKVDAALAPDVSLTAQMAAVAGIQIRQTLFTWWDQWSLYLDGSIYSLVAGGGSNGLDIAGRVGASWEVSGWRLDFAVGMLDQTMKSTTKAPNGRDGTLTISTHYASKQLMVALWL